MVSDPPSSSLNISGSSQSILGGAVVARSRSASVSGHSSRTSTPWKRPNRKSEPSLHGALRRIPKAKSIMPPPPLNALEVPREEESPFQGACAGIPPEGEIEHTTDVRVLNQLVVGLNPNEVFAAFQSQWERINFAESTANQVYEEANSVISQLRSQIQGLIDNRNSQMTQAHDRMMHDIGIRDLQISQLSNDNSQLQTIVEQLKKDLENSLSSKDRFYRDFQELSQRSQFQINHLESELSQARVAEAKHRDMIRTLEDRLAALRATSSSRQAVLRLLVCKRLGRRMIWFSKGFWKPFSIYQQEWIMLNRNTRAIIIRIERIHHQHLQSNQHPLHLQDVKIHCR